MSEETKRMARFLIAYWTCGVQACVVALFYIRQDWFAVAFFIVILATVAAFQLSDIWRERETPNQ